MEMGAFDIFEEVIRAVMRTRAAMQSVLLDARPRAQPDLQ
jgi:hypothetical protein